MPAAGVRAVPQALGRRPAHRLHQTQAAGHRAAGVQRRTGPHTPRHGSHTAGREQVQTSLVQGLRHAVQGLHDCQVSHRDHPRRVTYLYTTCI